jgi:hypothetical protein
LKEEQKQDQEIPEVGGSPCVRFCAVGYRPQSLGGTTFTILLVLEDANGDLLFLIHPNWRSLVQLVDVNYINDLLRDFLERAKEHPSDLFEQLSSLSVGPLATEQTGEQISDYPSLLELFPQFVQL